MRKPPDGKRLLAKGSERLTPVVVDVVDTDSIAAACAIVSDAVGEHASTGLVNNAGISITGPLEFVTMNDLRRQFEVNVFGLVHVTQRFLSLLRTAQGRVVNMGSIGGRSAIPFLGPCSMSKLALEAYSDALRREVYPWGLHVSCVEPGAIATPIWQKGIDWSDQARAAASPEATELYGTAMDGLRRLAEQTSLAAAAPELVVRAVHHGLTASTPKTRYLVGRDAKI